LSEQNYFEKKRKKIQKKQKMFLPFFIGETSVYFFYSIMQKYFFL